MHAKGRQFAQVARKFCGSLEQRCALETCQTFIPLNAELNAEHLAGDADDEDPTDADRKSGRVV
jgi:hypothetical protein